MPRGDFDDQLDTLRGDVVAMGELVLDRYEAALEARAAGDLKTAKRVIDGDREINEWYLGLERDCIDLFALQQPLASDLRLVASSFKIVTDLERVGDLATNLAAAPERPDVNYFPRIQTAQIATEAGDMLQAALQAYEDGSAGACWAVAERDDDLDVACKAAGEAVVDRLMAVDPADGADGLARGFSTVALSPGRGAHRRPCGQRSRPDTLHGRS